MKKIGFIILLILILPIAIFSVFEIGNLKQSERAILNIYKNQLEAILFSINQYSEEVISAVALKTETAINENPPDDKINSILNEANAVNKYFLFDKDFNFIKSYLDNSLDSVYIKELWELLNKNDTSINKIIGYFNNGYRKILPMKKDGNDMQYLIFISLYNDKNLVNLFEINPEKFISNVLDPKIQEATREKFYVTAYKKGSEKHVYNSDKQHEPGRVIEKSPFWLLQDYSIGIELKDKTISDITRERTKRNLIIIVLMDSILLTGIFIIFRNLKKQMELSQMKSDFVSSVSHEIRTPLALISMYIETLEMGRVKSNEKIREYYSVILNETLRLSNMVNRILSFSQIENKKRKYLFGTVNVNEIVENTIQTFYLPLKNKGFKTGIYYAKDLPDVTADKDAVSEAIVNLFDNAIKYSAEEKEINISTGFERNMVYIQVEDKGIGISQKNQKFIFDRFYRVTEKNLANNVKGSGLGLAIVKHIMDAHKGIVEVKSEPGKGSIFRLLFPSETQIK